MNLKPSARNLVRQGVYATLLYAVVATVNAAPGAAVVLPALTQPASGEHHVGKVIWADLVTPDLEAAKHFYLHCSAGPFAKCRAIRIIR